MTWQPLERAVPKLSAGIIAAAAKNPQLKQAIDDVAEIWRNDDYVVIVHRSPDTGHVLVLSIRRDDRQAVHDWRDFQRIKNQLAGEETEAVELYPAESRLVDSANQYWLWCFPPGEKLPFGFGERAVTEDTSAVPGAVQRPLGL